MSMIKGYVMLIFVFIIRDL